MNINDAVNQRSPVFRLFVAVMITFALGVAHAESLTPMRTTALPAIDANADVRDLAVVDGVPLAFLADSAWMLDAKKTHWTPGALPSSIAKRNISDVFGDEKRTFLLSDGRVLSQLQVVRGQVSARGLPLLPSPLTGAHGTVRGDVLYLAGIANDGLPRLLQLDLAVQAVKWQVSPGWPGTQNADSVVAQTGAVFVTVPGAAGEGDRLWRWAKDTGWTERGRVPGKVVPGSSRAMGQAHVFYLVRGADSGNTAAKPMTFHTITNAWATLPGANPVDVAASAPWQDGVFWAQRAAGSGRIEFAYAQVQSGKLMLKWLDWVVIVVYLAAMIGIGLYFYLREKRNSTSNFFVGGRSIPFWAAGVSLYAANTSSISFIAIPAKAFETNWQYLTNNLIAVIGLMFVAVWIVPLLRRLNLMSVFSYLETRFHPAIRMLASALAIITQIGSRMSVILFLPSLAISTITGISVVWSVMLMGGFTIIYTAMGGMKAVIWTDVVQVIVKMGGAIFAIGFIVWKLHGNAGELISTAMAEGKMHLLDFSFDLTKATVWGFIFLVVFDVVLTFPKDQVLMQRTLSTKSDKEAGRSIWAFAAIMIPGGFVFYMIGTALFVYYKAHPERMNPLLPIDATFPLFIAAELPTGVTGLIIAGIFAAAMATLSGIMNSVATLVSVDFYDRLVKDPSQKKSVFFAEIMTVVVGLVGMGAALLLSRFDVHSLFDVSIELAGLLGGGFAGAYTLGMFTRRANSPGVAIGIGSSIALTLVAWSFDLVHPYFYLAISILLCIVIGYLASLLFPAPTRSLEGLTIYGSRKDAAAQ
ncbi:MAG TPA: sodium:solute symporter [Lysobacter sp.]|jgi:SSS family transporter|nr:sodium:solute symporter [Lysobacter sp.]